jgi:hypothetical protein
MLEDAAFWGAVLVALSVIITGYRVTAHIDAMNASLSNGSNHLHAVMADKLIAIEDLLEKLVNSSEGVEYQLDKIADHTEPPKARSPFD